jgi:16S rRNA (uracil1498-N3)-methyltransferase
MLLRRRTVMEGRRAEPHRYAAAEDAAAHTFTDELADTVEISGDDGHHLQRVRRLRAGEHLTIADGAGVWRRYEIEDVSPGTLRCGARSERFEEPDLRPHVSLAVALTKAGALDTVVARCTEIGVARVTPIRTRHCVVRWDAAQSERAVARLRRTAREAAAQSRRARLPEIAPVTDLAAVASRPGAVIAERGGIAVAQLELPAANNFSASLQHEFASDLEWIVIVGPEGGLDTAELAGMEHLPRIGLGSHVLRAETAPIVAVALLLDRVRALCRE